MVRLLATITMQRAPSIETERLLLVALVPEDIEPLIAGDLERVSLLTGFTFLPEDPKLGADLSWHLRALRIATSFRGESVSSSNGVPTLSWDRST
jgi:hypothetical protein